MSGDEQDPHKLYEQKLTELGKRSGFEIKGKDTSIGWLDCVWRLKESIKFVKSEEYYVSKYGLPVVAFEVVYSEKAKQLRGSLFNMISAKPSLAVFVLLKRTRQQHYPSEDVDRTERYIKDICREFAGLIRTEIWQKEDVDKLYDEIVGYYHPSGEKDARFQEGNILLSFRNLDTIAIIDPGKESFVWCYGLGVLDGQHQPTMLDNGHILVFDNGTYRGYSVVWEINPLTDCVW